VVGTTVDEDKVVDDLIEDDETTREDEKMRSLIRVQPLKLTMTRGLWWGWTWTWA
jgi:hypothetical protein